MLNEDSDQNAQVSLTLRKLGHDAKGQLINVKMGLEIMAHLDADAQSGVSSEMISTLQELQGLLEETFLFAQLQYLDRELLSLVSIVSEFEQSAIWPLHIDAVEAPRVAVDAQRLVKMLHWWQRLQSPAKPASIKVLASDVGSTLKLSWHPVDNSSSNERLLLFADAFATQLGGTCQLNQHELLLLLPPAST